MNIWVTVLLFAVGVALVVKGGDFFVDAASWIAKAFGIPSFIVGATIVSVATTLPEMIVSVIASLEGKTDMAVGNAVGSVTANTGLIMALALLFMHVICKRKDYMRQCLLLIMAAAALLAGSQGGSLSWAASIVLVLIFAYFIYINVKEAASKREEQNDRPEKTKKDVTVNIIKFVVGAAAIVGGSQLLVNSGSDLAAFFGVPERIIAVTLVAIGTSLPELVTTITAIVKKESALSIGNLIGANILDLSLILPICSAVSGQQLPVSAACATIDIPVCLGMTLLGLLPLLIREKGSRWQGAVLIMAYVGYLIVVL